MTIDRRAFLRLAGSAAICACAGAAGTSGCSPAGKTNTPVAAEGSYRRQAGQVVVTLSAAGGLATVGGAVRLALDDREVNLIVVHSGDQVYHAFADRCTHNGKELDYIHADKQLACRSRKSRFDLAGSLIEGPARGGLEVYPVHRQNDTLVIDVSSGLAG